MCLCKCKPRTSGVNTQFKDWISRKPGNDKYVSQYFSHILRHPTSALLLSFCIVSVWFIKPCYWIVSVACAFDDAGVVWISVCSLYYESFFWKPRGPSCWIFYRFCFQWENWKNNSFVEYHCLCDSFCRVQLFAPIPPSPPPTHTHTLSMSVFVCLSVSHSVFVSQCLFACHLLLFVSACLQLPATDKPMRVTSGNWRQCWCDSVCTYKNLRYVWWDSIGIFITLLTCSWQVSRAETGDSAE